MIERPRQGEWRTPVRAAGLLEPGVEAFPIRVRIVQNGVETGWDEGALGFEEDALWFSGTASSFRIAARDLVKTHRGKGIGLHHPTRKLFLTIEVLAAEGRKEWVDEVDLAREIERLRSRESEDGDSQYPPLKPRPGLVVPRHRWARYRPLLFVVGAICFLLPLATHSAADNLVRIGTIASLILFFLTGENPNQATLRKIAREEAHS